MRKNKSAVILGLLTLGMVLTGCGSANSSSASYDSLDGASAKGDYGYASDDVYETATEDYEMNDYGAEEGSTITTKAENVASNRKLIRRVEMNVETQEFDILLDKIEARISELGGYVESSSVNGNTYNGSGTRSANYTARVPANRLDEFVTSVSQQSNVTNKSESAQDVTLDYVDTKSRKEALEVEQERMMKLLEQAEDLDTIIGLEQRLTNIRYELQNYESQIRTYDNLVDFATITIGVREVKVYTPVETPEKSDWDRMVDGFVASVLDVGNGIKNFLIGLVIALPYLVIWGAIIGMIVTVIVKRVKNSDKRKEKKEAKAKAKAEKAAAKAKEKEEKSKEPTEM